MGRLTNTVDENIFEIPSSSKKDKVIKENKVSNNLSVVPDGLKVDWYQQQNFITMVVYLKESPKKVIIISCYFVLQSSYCGYAFEHSTRNGYTSLIQELSVYQRCHVLGLCSKMVTTRVRSNNMSIISPF